MPDPGRELRALELLNEIARVSSEGLELKPLLDRITETLVHSFDWDHVGFVRVDHERGVFVSESVCSRIETQVKEGHSRPIGAGIVGRVAASGRPIAVVDATEHPDFVSIAEGIRTEVCLPVLRAGETVAVLNLEDRRKKDLDDEYPLLDAVARQIGGAIANARLHEEVSLRVQQFELVSDLLHFVLEAEELEPLLSRLADRLRELFDFLMVDIYLVDPYSSRLDLKAISTRVPVERSEVPGMSVGRGVIGRALQLGRAQLVFDIKGDPDYIGLMEETTAELAIPIRFRDRKLGVFNFENDRAQVFSQDTVSLLQLLCDQLAGVLHLASVNEKLSETSGELTQANRRLSEMNRTLVELSTVDSLTGLANRRQFDRLLDLEWRRAIRSRLPIALLLVDIDFFKAYNDGYGHLRGDAALNEVAKALASSFSRAGDLVARYGGEEFAALLPNTTEEGALDLAESARARVEARAIQHRGTAGVRGGLTVSVGVASIGPDESIDASRLVAAADRALYLAKDAGRNCVRWADPRVEPDG